MQRGDTHAERLDVEWLAVTAGVKPAARVALSDAHVDGFLARAQRARLAVARAAAPVQFPGRPAAWILYVAPDAARARALCETEAPLLPPHGAQLAVAESLPRHAALGALLGFPACCVAAFGARLQRGVTRRAAGGEAHEDFVAAEDAVQRTARPLARLNDLAADRQVRVITFYPCRYDCDAAAAYADAVLAAADAAAPRAAAALRQALGGLHAIAADGRRGAAEHLAGEILQVEFAAP